jgi:hypothetical protein
MGLRRGRLAMGDVNIYLVPETGVDDPARTRADLARLLQGEGIILEEKDRFYPASERSECYVVGNNNRAAFDLDDRDGDWAFQTCEIYGHPEPTIVPQVPGVEPSCPSCGADVSADFHAFISWRDDFSEPMPCPACGVRSRVDALKDEVGIVLTTFYICFREAGRAEMRPQWLQQLSAKTGIRFKKLSYWFT